MRKYRLPSIEAPEDDQSYRALIERVVAGEVVAWQELVERINPFLNSLLGRFANADEDIRSELFVFVLERLRQADEQGREFHRLRRYMQGLNRFGKGARFNSWFTVVVNNLVSDYFRDKLGRRTVPTAIRRMSLTCQEIFKLIYWKYLSEAEAFESTCNQAEISREEFDTLVERVNRRLSATNRWSLLTEQKQRQNPVSMDTHSRPDRQCPEARLSDPAPRANPLAAIIARSHRKKAITMRLALRQAISALPMNSLMLLICRYKYDLTANELMNIFGIRDVKRVYLMLNRIHSHLMHVLRARGLGWEEVEHGLMSMEGFFDEIAELDQHVISPRFDSADRPAEIHQAAEHLLA